MYEVEAKVPVTQKQRLALQKKLTSLCSKPRSLKIDDIYYQQPRGQTVRLRDASGKVSFDLKHRSTKEGIESNLEMEWGIANLSKWKELLMEIGLTPRIEKQKESLVYEYAGFRLELNKVSSLGTYLEIEKVVDKPSGIPKAKKELMQIFRTLGYSPQDLEPKPYLELIENAEKAV